ncbi:MAG: two-component system, OmpR family, response regulator RpaB [Parcubacteria bacterium C7867-005]|nr:MAG: two-component system, OmpR family, response regulator RpaB [Parcubacteria bacterium C7867-005]
MILDDDPLLVDLYSTAFTLFGYEVVTGFRGDEGLQKLIDMDIKPIIILSDVMMPNMHGLDFLRKIKEDPKLKTIPVVLLTNLDGTDDIRRGLELGAVTYIVKSAYSPKEVVNKVKEILAGYDREKTPEVKTIIKGLSS